MSLLVYCICDADANRLFGEGLDDEPLYGIAEGPLLAVVSEHNGAEPKPTAATLCVYEQTVRRLMECRAILPARFASVVEDQPAVRALLRRRRAELRLRLERIRGAVEIGLRASWVLDGLAQPDVKAQSGASYLRDRLQLRQRAERVARQLDPLAATALSSRRTVSPRPDLPVRDAYLVEQKRVGEFVALVEQLDAHLNDVALVCTGPWPPYSFAEGAPV